MKNKKLHSWEKAEDKEEEEEEEGGGREVGVMVGMLSTLIIMKSFDALWSLRRLHPGTLLIHSCAPLHNLTLTISFQTSQCAACYSDGNLF